MLEPPGDGHNATQAAHRDWRIDVCIGSVAQLPGRVVPTGPDRAVALQRQAVVAPSSDGNQTT